MEQEKKSGCWKEVEFQVEFVLVCSHHSCSEIYGAIVTRGDVARVSTNLVLEIGRQSPN
mgnify:CR=1 FL=1